MPRSQIETARFDEAAGIINVVGPFEDGRPGVATLLIHVTLIQGAAHAHGTGSDTKAPPPPPGPDPVVPIGRWSAPLETSGQFKAGEHVEAFGLVVLVSSDPGSPRLHHETFTWSERVMLDKQL